MGGGCHGGFAQHVERIAVIRVVALAAARERFLDGATHHELMPHDPHRLANREADHRLAEAPGQPAKLYVKQARPYPGRGN